MGLTYTENIGLAMQEDKRDKLDWDALTGNWKTIDAQIGALNGRVQSAAGAVGSPVAELGHTDAGIAGYAEPIEQEG